MTTFKYCVAGILLVISGAAGAADVAPPAAAPAKDRFEAATAKLRKQHASTVAAAAAVFSEKLDALIAKAKDAGNLDLVLTLKSEKAKVAQGDATKGVGLPADAVTARQTYDAAVRKARAEYDAAARDAHAKFLAELADLEKAETKADRIESAVAVRAYRQQTDKAGPPPLNDAAATTAAPAAGSMKPFAWRVGAEKAKLLRAGGGSDESEAAVARGLAWLVKQQQKDGSWKTDGSQQLDIAGTGLGLLPFLAAGDSHQKGNTAHTKVVQNAITFLVRRQNPAGDFRGSTTMYEHAIATQALCEAYSMTGDFKLRKPAQLAVTFIVRAQHAAGGWRYMPGQQGDTSVTAWQVSALTAAKLAGLDVPAATFKKASQFLDTVANQDGTKYGYTDRGGGSLATTIAGMHCQQHLGWGADHDAVAAAAPDLEREAFDDRRLDVYLLNYAAPVLYRDGRDWAKTWNPKIRDMLVRLQDKTGKSTDGSWKPDASHVGSAGGRHATTCLALLVLEVYYRYPPLEKHKSKG